MNREKEIKNRLTNNVSWLNKRLDLDFKPYNIHGVKADIILKDNTSQIYAIVELKKTKIDCERALYQLLKYRLQFRRQMKISNEQIVMVIATENVPNELIDIIKEFPKTKDFQFIIHKINIFKY